MRASALLVATILLLGGGGLSGCGTDTDTPVAQDPTSATSSSSPTATAGAIDAEDGLPECAQVWRDGVRLPTGYRGCDEEGRQVKPDHIRCSFGLQIVTHADRFYAVPGDQINEVGSLAEDPDFERTVSSCQA